MEISTHFCTYSLLVHYYIWLLVVLSANFLVDNEPNLQEKFFRKDIKENGQDWRKARFYEGHLSSSTVEFWKLLPAHTWAIGV